MKSAILKCLLVGILSLVLGSGMTYASQREKPGDTDKTAGKTMTITGCLQKGDEAGEYSIKDADGKEYKLRSMNIKLENHMDHKVTVTGKMVQTDKEKADTQHVDVTDLKMISATCQ